MNISEDPYDNGTSKYSTTTDIFDGLKSAESGEEIGILSEMFADISWEGQDYYYTDNAGTLVERWEQITGYGDKMWLMDIAAWQLSDDDANGLIYEILCNDDLAKRIGFKKLFVDSVLSGQPGRYKEVSEAFAEELRELDYFDYTGNMKALGAALTSIGWDFRANPYRILCTAVYDKCKALKLETERALIIESRALLTSYDDFIFGLKANQALYTEQEKAYQNKVAMLQSKYNAALKMLLSMAQEQGVVLKLPEKLLLDMQKDGEPT